MVNQLVGLWRFKQLQVDLDIFAEAGHGRVGVQGAGNGLACVNSFDEDLYGLVVGLEGVCGWSGGLGRGARRARSAVGLNHLSFYC